MTLKEKFPAEDWEAVLQGPMMAGFAVTAADPSGLIGTVQESAAIAATLRSAKEGAEGALAKEVADGYAGSEGRTSAMGGVKALIKGKKPLEASEAAVKRLGEIAGIVDRVAPEHAAEFRAFLMAVATKTAEAAKEGGFLGFGGVPISEAEHKTLDDLRGQLGQMA
ncbi:hypothetical protein AB1M95_04190 [Sulfitobacter sp. LCG007]